MTPVRTQVAPCRLGSSLLLVACFASSLAAQQPEIREGYRPIPPHKLKTAKAGKRYSISYLKFNKIFETELKLDGGKRGTRIVSSRLEGQLRVRDKSKLQESLRSRKDTLGTSIQPSVTNIQVFGRVTLKGQKRILNVDRVVVIETQLDRFTRRATKLGEQDAKARRELIRLIDYSTRYFPADKKDVSGLRKRLLSEARAIAVAKLPDLPAGASQRIEVGLAQKDIELVAEVWVHPKVSAAERKHAESALRKLRATRYRGRWVHLTDLKNRLGFVVSDRRWIRQEQLWLEDAIGREKQRLANSQPRRDYSERDMMRFMRSGKIVRGMEKAFVIAARKAAGKKNFYPVRVERKREKREQQELVWELWITAEGVQIYFFNGWVTERIEVAGGVEDSGDGDGEDGDGEDGDGDKTEDAKTEDAKTEDAKTEDSKSE
ncbi:MAG: hypothetical protein JKY65_07040 [Planctomycetes bacterium]|nr:hypothetical protein [Planctomycetota bacterium]